MKIFRCELITHDFFFFSSYEANILVKTEKVIHNYSLTFAINNISRVLNKDSTPHYDADLRNLEFYATPSILIEENGIVAHTYNAINDTDCSTESRGAKTYPVHGMYLKLSPLSRFEFFVFSLKNEKIRRVVKIGKKDSTAIIQYEELQWRYIAQEERKECSHAVSPVDLPSYLNIKIEELREFYLIPPSYLYNKVTFRGKYILGKSETGSYYVILPTNYVSEEVLQ